MCLPCLDHPPRVPEGSAAQTPLCSPWLLRASLWQSPLQFLYPLCLPTLLPIERHIPRAQDSPQDRVCVGGQHTPGLRCEPMDWIGPFFSGSVASDFMLLLHVLTCSWAPARCAAIPAGSAWDYVPHTHPAEARGFHSVTPVCPRLSKWPWPETLAQPAHTDPREGPALSC